MKRMHWIAALGVALAVLVLVGCGSSPSPAAQASRGGSDLPDWYLNPGEVYPDGTYLVSVGTGDTRRAAEQQAMAGLAQSFEASIQVDVTTQERYRDLVTALPTVTDGHITVPPGPGLGLALNPELDRAFETSRRVTRAGKC